MHIPVLKKEVIEYLDPKPNQNFIDCTINGGGHSLAILEKIKPNGKILGIDWDEGQIKNLKLLNSERITRSEATGSQIKNFRERLILVNDSYANLKRIVEQHNFYPVNGIFLDLGMSSWHLSESKKGFSFSRDEILDMRYDDKNEITAEKIINTYSEEQIEKILREYGEEKFSRRIAKKIGEERKLKQIRTTFQLVEILKKAIPPKYHHGRINFATRTFQALRIAVNDELRNLEKVLPQAEEIILSGGRLAVISFHSLEDRIVKNFLKENKQYFKILTKKPITPNKEEIINNPVARSAKLRVAEKI